MKTAKKFLGVVLSACLILSLLPATVLADDAPAVVVIGDTGYNTLSDALAAAADGDVIMLNESITESVNYTVSADKTVTINGCGNTLTGDASCVLSLTGAGTVILKNLTLQSGASSGTSTGLDVSGSVSVQSYGTVTANGSAATATSSYGVTNSGTGTVDVTEAVAAGMQSGVGAYNTGSGTINVGSATGSGAVNGAGAYNGASGTINVTTASGNRYGVRNLSGGTVNVTTATSTDANDPYSSAVSNNGDGTVNAGTITGAATNSGGGTVNAGNITGTTNSGSGTVNTGNDVTVVPLHVGTGASCVLNSITIAKSGSIIGTLPDVYKGSECSAEWYTGIALTNLFTMQEISGEATLYSSFYTIETAEDLAAYITEVSRLTADVSGSTVTVTGTATVTTTSDAALIINIPAGVTVVWKASLSGGGNQYLLKLTGDGNFEVAAGASIVNDTCMAAIYCCNGEGNLIITGGSVSTSNDPSVAIIIAGDWLLTMTGGTVSDTVDNSVAIDSIDSKNSVVIVGGTVSAGTDGSQLGMSATSVYRSGILDPGKIICLQVSSAFAEVCVDAEVTQAVSGTNTGLTATGHNLFTGDSVSAVWAKQNGVSGVNILYYSANDGTVAAEEWFLAVPGVTVAATCTVTFNKNGGDTEASPTTKTVVSGETVDALPTAPTRSGYSFTGWNTASDGSGASFTAVVKVKSDITLYAQWSKNSDTGNGGVSGGSTTTTSPVTTVNGLTATTTVTPTISGGKATGSVTESQMGDALAKAKAAAGTSGLPIVQIQVSGASGASSVSTIIPRASIQALVSSGVGALTISGPTGSVSFDTAALKTISGIASGDVTVTAVKADTSRLSDAAKQQIGDRPVYSFSVTSGGTTISQFSGNVTVSVPYTPVAGEDTNAIVIYYINAQGELKTVTNGHYDAATGTVVFDTNHFSTYAVGYNKVNFTDVSNAAWYADAVSFIAARGITSGTTTVTFSPDATLTRGQFITLLLRAYGISSDANPTDNFSDAGDTYYTGYLAAAKKLGITNGVGSNMFAPDQVITRQEMLTMLYNTLKVLYKLPSGVSGKTLSDFTDNGSIATWAQESMSYLVKTGAVSGNNGVLNPNVTTTRAEFAQVLYNLLGK